MQIFDLYPIPVGVFQCPEHSYYKDLTFQLINGDSSRIDDLEQVYRDENNNVLKFVNEFHPLKKHIEGLCKTFNDSTYAYNCDEWVLTNSWINLHDSVKNFHTHANSFYSGTYYVNLKEHEHSKISFLKTEPEKSAPFIEIEKRYQTKYNANVVEFKNYQEGEILIWRSELQHGVPPRLDVDNNTQKNRITLAFNLVPKEIFWGAYGFKIQAE